MLKAIAASRFSATILVEPGLLHYELGWPNQLGFSQTLGPLTVDCSGGMIFRASTTEIVNGFSFQARGSLKLEAKIDLGFLGASLTAHASVAYGTRYIGFALSWTAINFALIGFAPNFPALLILAALAGIGSGGRQS